MSRSGADPLVKVEDSDVSPPSDVESGVQTVALVTEANPDSSHSNEGMEGANMTEHLSSNSNNTDDKTQLLPVGFDVGIHATLTSLEVKEDNTPPILSIPPIHELGDGQTSKKNSGLERCSELIDECSPVASVHFYDDLVTKKIAGEKLAKGVKYQHPASSSVQRVAPSSLQAKPHYQNQDEAFTNLDILQHSIAVDGNSGLNALTPISRTNVPAQSSPNDHVQDEEEKEDMILIPEAFLVEANAPDTDVSSADNFVVGTLLETDEHHSWHDKKWRKLVLAAVCLVVIVISIALGISLSSLDNKNAAIMEKVVYKTVRASNHPSLSPSSTPSVSTYPSSLPTVTSAPTLQKETLFKDDCDDDCWPVVEVYGNMAVAIRSEIDIQFFSFANNSKSSNSFELINQIEIDYAPYDAAFNGETAVVSFSNGTYPDAHAAYVYEKNESGIWYEVALLEPHDFNIGTNGEAYYTSTGPCFGRSVAIDGDIIAVGADDDGNIGEGAVYIFRRNQTTWVEEAKLLGPRLAEGYGFSVSVKGNILVVGDLVYDTYNTGAVFFYEYDYVSNFWNQSNKTLTSNSCSFKFGSVVRLTYDGALLVVCKGDNSTYYYEKEIGSSGANEYTLKQKIPFENSLWSLKVEGDTMVASEYREHISLRIHYFIRRNHVWEQVNILDEPVLDEYFGWYVSVFGNVTLIASEKNVYIV